MMPYLYIKLICSFNSGSIRTDILLKYKQLFKDSKDYLFVKRPSIYTNKLKWEIFVPFH